MNFDHELLKDLICEKNPSTIRKNIIFENVHWVEPGYILVKYRTLICSSGGAIPYSRNNFSVSINGYVLRLKQKERDNKLNDILNDIL